ncbi:MAG: carbohydrate-binding domain-containing protein [Bacteroidales bacterium]|nr:carbohydrate-binding domain-containing protein [Bacteroidales bacterium]
MYISNLISYPVILLSMAFVASACEKNSESEDIISGIIDIESSNDDDNIANSVFSKIVKIKFSNSVTVDNSYEKDGVTISYSGNDVSIKSTAKEVEYQLSGDCDNGSLRIESDNKFKLLLDGVNLYSPNSPAINIQSKKRAFIVVNEGTTNSLKDGENYSDSSEDRKGTLFSEGQMIFYGNGELVISSNYKHAICSDQYVRIVESNIKVENSAKDAVHVNDAFIMDGGKLDLVATSDGIQCDEGYIYIGNGDIRISSYDDGIVTSYQGTDNTVNPSIQIKDGNIDIYTFGSSAKGIKSIGDLTIDGGSFSIETIDKGSEGIESKKNLVINNGKIKIIANDDCINAAKSITINGGEIYVYSDTNDGVDSNGTLTITGGKVFSVGSGMPEEGFDCDQNTFTITGGEIIGIGGATSTPTANKCTQNSLLYTTQLNSGELLNLSNSDGENIFVVKMPRSLNQTTLLYSSPSLKLNNSYNIYKGGSYSQGTDFNGWITDTDYTIGTLLKNFTASTIVNNYSSGGMGGGGGFVPGGFPRTKGELPPPPPNGEFPPFEEGEFPPPPFNEEEN